MQFNLFLVLGLVGSVIASPIQLETRDTTVIDAAIRRVTNALTKLDDGFRTRRQGGDAQAAQRETSNLLFLHKNCVQEIRIGEREIRRGPNVGPVEAVSLLSKIDGVVRLLQVAINGWKDSKKMVVAAGQTKLVHDELQSASEASQRFSDAVVSKLPLLEQASGQAIKLQIVRIMDAGIYEYRRN